MFPVYTGVNFNKFSVTVWNMDLKTKNYLGKSIQTGV